jgi:DNA polymerase III sliding clamp (beta) subunit (PCNA family)
MNKITLPAGELKMALSGLSKIISKRAALPVLQHVRVERLSDGALTISATDLDAFASYRFEEGGEGNAESILVPLPPLHSIVKGCAGKENIGLEKLTGDRIAIRYQIGGQDAEQQIPFLPVEEWPAPPKINGERALLNGALRSALLEALKCASTDETRYVLRSAYIDVSDKGSHYVVGTDGRHLYSSNSFHIPIESSVIIPDHRFLAWKELAQDGDWELRVKLDKDQPAFVEISSYRWSFVCKAIEGTFPNWRQVLPDLSGFKSRIRIPASALNDFIEVVTKLPFDGINHPIGIKLGAEGKLILFGRAPGTDKLTEAAFAAVEANGDPVTICLNRDYLIKAFRFELTEVQIADSLSPIRCSDQSGRQMIIMPIRLDGVTPISPTQPSSLAPVQAQSSTTQKGEMQSTQKSNGEAITRTRENKRTSLETAVEQIEAVRGAIKASAASLHDVITSLKQAQRKQRGTEKEIQSVRSTLQNLRRVKT